MEIGQNNFATYSAVTSRPQPLAKAEPMAQAKVEEPKEKTLIEEIREKGFGTFIDELKEQKKEEMRAKILESMGLTEEALANMSPEQRAQIEKMVAQEILKRMTAEAELNKADENKMGLHTAGSLFDVTPGQTQIDATGVGLGPLLALQEIEQNAEQNPPKEEEIAG